MHYPRYICIHGHFYQPPRENPWLDVVEVEDSAAPFHDWNERITRECYAPNTRARLLDRDGADHQPSEQLRLDELQFRADALAVDGRARPGRAPRDRRGRPREPRPPRRARQCAGAGLQPPDHAAGEQARQGDAGRLGHRRLPPSIRPRSRGDVAGGDGRRYSSRWRCWPRPAFASRSWLPGKRGAGGRRAARNGTSWPTGSTRRAPTRAACRRADRSPCFFSMPSSRTRSPSSVCSMTASGSSIVCPRASTTAASTPQLMHIATDGESYGHHHAHGDMALAYVLDRLADDPDVRLTNYGEFLELHPPEWEVEIHENSSWSCVARRRALAVRLRLPDARRVGPAVARSAPPGARRAQGPARPPLRHAGPGVLSQPLGGAQRLHRGHPQPRLRRRRSLVPRPPRPSRPGQPPRSPTPCACWKCSGRAC